MLTADSANTTRGQLMKNDKMKLQMRFLRLISMTSIGIGLWVLIDQLVYDYDRFDITPALPFLFAGWIGIHGYKVMSDLSDRIVSMENHQMDA